VRHGIPPVFEEGINTKEGELVERRNYLIAKLPRNPDISVSSVIDDFLKE
jgi:hypothetical protein